MSEIDSLDSDTYCLDGLFLSAADRIILGLGGFVISVATFLLIMGFAKYEKLRKQPGDLILGIAISDLILSFHWMIQAAANETVQDETFCTFNGAIGVFVGSTQVLYNIAFSLFLVVSLRNALQQSKIPKMAFHIASLGLTAIFVVYLLLNSEIGKDLAGTCSIKTSCGKVGDSLWGLSVMIVYAAISFYAYRYIKKNAPKCGRTNAKKVLFLMYYLKYIVLSTILYAIVSASNIAADYFINSANLDQTNWILTIYQAAKVCSPLVLTFIRYNDPLIKDTMTKSFMFWRKEMTDISETTKLELEATNETPVLEPILIKQESLSRDFICNQLSSNRKLEITFTLLSSILYAQNFQKNEEALVINSESPHENNTKDPYKHRRVHRLDEKTVVSEIPRMKMILEATNSNLLAGTFQVYAPKVFHSFIEKDKCFLNIEESLDFAENKEQILAASGADGGRSGEFFFFSKDTKIIIKTTTDEQMRVLNDMLKDYDNHFKEFPGSLISIIYGAYTFESSELGLKFNLIMMKNVCGFPSSFVSRVYDLKGSTYQREVLKKITVSDRSHLKDQVLKDLDFEKYEKKLFMPRDIRDHFLKQVKQDALFLKKVKVIDYSFIVFYVNKVEFRKKQKKHERDYDDFTELNPFGSIPNTHEHGVYYNIGIIDYLQPYNFLKTVEKYAKRLQNMNTHLDTSIQDPDFYSTRFYESIDQHVSKE